MCLNKFTTKTKGIINYNFTQNPTIFNKLANELEFFYDLYIYYKDYSKIRHLTLKKLKENNINIDYFKDFTDDQILNLKFYQYMFDRIDRNIFERISPGEHDDMINHAIGGSKKKTSKKKTSKKKTSKKKTSKKKTSKKKTSKKKTSKRKTSKKKTS
jgi:hypothetical protein